MTTQEVAEKFVNYCRQGQFEEAQNDLYHDNIKSVEPAGGPYPDAQGIEAIKAKGQQWAEMVEEVHSAKISDPIVADNYFSLSMINDVTFKQVGRMTVEEICVYGVENGKIVLEQFFFTPPPQH